MVGGGPAGAASAIYASRKGIRTGVAAERFGGQVLDTMAIENFVSVSYTEGPKLAAALEQHVHQYDVDVMNLQRATKLVPPTEPNGLVTVKLANGATLSSRTVVLSTGARWRAMNVPGEDQYRNKGVTYCPHCDGPLFKGKRVAVIGGGNSGAEAAIDLAGVVRHVTLIEFDDALRADEVLQAKLRSLPNVDIILGALTTEVLGDGEQVTGLTYTDRASDTVPHRRARRHLRADRPAPQHGVARGRRRAVAPRRGHHRRPRPDVGPGRVRRRRLHHGAVQADRDRDGRRRHRRPERLRPPDPHPGPRRRHRGRSRPRAGRRLTPTTTVPPAPAALAPRAPAAGLRQTAHARNGLGGQP